MAFFAGAAIGRVILDTAQYVEGVEKVQKSNAKLNKGMSGLGGIYAALAAKAVQAFKDSAIAANEFQKKVANVATLVDTATVDVGGMAKELLLLSGELGDAKDLTGALYQALSASVEPAKAVEFVANSAKFAGAALISTEKSVDLLTTSINAYGKENLSASEASDKLFSIIKLGKTDGQQLSSVIGKSIPLAANMGVSFDELGASIAIMTRQGVKSAEATTQFNSTLTAFLKPSDDMKAALKEIGFETGSAAVEQLGFKGAIDAVIAATDGSKDATAGLFRNTRALRGVMALTGDAAKDYGTVLAQIKESAGATDIAFKKQEKTWETLENQMGKIQIIMGGVAKSFVDELAVGATAAADGMIRFLLAGQGADILTDIVAGVVSVFEILKTAIKPLVELILPSLVDLWNNLTGNLNRLLSPAGDTAGVFKVLAGAVQLGASILKVFVIGTKTLITTIVDLVIAIKHSGGIIDTFFKALEGKAKFSDVTQQINRTGRAFESLAAGAKENYGAFMNTVWTETKEFKERTESAANDIQITWETTFERAKTGTLVDFQEIITGWGKLSDEGQEASEDTANAAVESSQVIRLANGQMLNEALNNYNSQQVAYRSLTDAQIEEINRLAEAAGEAADEQLRLNKEVAEATIASYEEIGSVVLPVFEAIGTAIGEGTSVWEAFKDAGLDAIAAIVKGFGEQWLVLSAAAFVPGPTFNPAAGVGYAAAAAAAFVAAGAISAFEDGGRATPGMALVGEAGPELVQFNKGANVIPNDELGGMGKEIVFYNTFNVYNDMDAEMVSQQLGRRVQSVIRG